MNYLRVRFSRAGIYLLVWLLADVPVCLSQQNKSDSLKNLLTTAPQDTNCVIALQELSRNLSNQGDLRSAMEYAKEGLELAKKLNYTKGLAALYGNMGVILENRGDYAEALKNHLMALKHYESVGYKKGIAGAYNNIGSIYLLEKNYAEALRYYNLSKQMKEQLGNKKALINAYNNIGLVYYEQHIYDEALSNYAKSLGIAREVNDKRGISNALNNIGIIEEEKGNLDVALQDYTECLNIRREMNDHGGIAAALLNLGVLATKKKMYREANDYLIQAEKLSKEIGTKNNLKEVYRDLAYLESLQGNYKGAFEYQKLFTVYSDSLWNEESSKKIVEQQMQYEFDKKEAISKAEQEKKDAVSRIVIYSISGGLVLVLVFAVFIFRSYMQKHKANLIITAQKAEVERQKLLVEEKQREIIDSITYARRIQASLLPNDKYFEKHLNSARGGRGMR